MEKEDLRFYIKTRTILGISPITVHEELTTAYGAQVISYSTVQKWSKLFRDGRMELEDNERSGRPHSAVTEENIERVQEIIEQDPLSTYDEIEAETSLSHYTLYTIIHGHLKLEKRNSRWVPQDGRKSSGKTKKNL